MNSPSDLAGPLRGTGAHLAADELFAFTRFFDSARLVAEALTVHLDERHGMTLADYEVLVRLDGAADETRLTALAEACVLPPATLTQTLVGLEDRGWIQREKAVGDGRGVIVRLLPDGARALAAASPGHARIIKDLVLDCWGAEHLAAIGEAMAASVERLRLHRA